MTDGFTQIESALLDSLERERALLHQRDLVNGMVLHEIANAVTVVAGGLDLIKHANPASPTYTFALERVGSGVQVMSEMIRGLRVLQESVGELPVFQRGDLYAFVRNVVTDPVLVAENAARRVLVFNRDKNPQTLFCSTLLRHALGNLVRNALKYSLAGSPVTVVIGARDERRWIHVLNRGPKLNPTVAKHLFEPGRKSQKGGMGFGLHITQACALRMGGRVVFGSTGTTTVFSLLLPHETTMLRSAVIPSALASAPPASLPAGRVSNPPAPRHAPTGWLLPRAFNF
ncbi:MAG: sensor histidine kinase [Sulfuricaulis sp.]|nr:sensor histidine kinase [Sulfuricaulis sp.]